MVEIKVTATRELDLWKLSNFMYDARKNTVIDTKSRTLEHIYEHRKKLTSDHNMILTAYENDEIIGILRIFTGFPEMAFTSLWDPIITQKEGRERREEIALELLNASKEFVKDRGFSRLEILVSPLTEKHSKMYKENQSWYEKAGFYKATEEVLLQVELENYQLLASQPSLPEGFRFESIDNVTNDEIEGPFFETFAHGRDRLFVDMNKAQQMVSFNHWFTRDRPFHRSTILVMKGDDVVGFNVVRVDDDTAEIGPVGVIPKYHRQGIMKAVLHESFKRLKEDGINVGRLEADKSNEPAITMYMKYGFKKLYEQEYFAWRVD
ncbi:MAG: GNAT family N-acetyltransferase [Candidatus Thorarchaeota archaeon]